MKKLILLGAFILASCAPVPKDITYRITFTDGTYKTIKASNCDLANGNIVCKAYIIAPNVGYQYSTVYAASNVLEFQMIDGGENK